MEQDQRLLQRILDGAEDPTDLKLELLRNITNDFSEERKIGAGGSGAVYKGVLGELTVAVKKIYVNLNKLDNDDKKFGREFNSLFNINHRNVVRFLGFCSNIYQKRIIHDGEIILASVRERLFCFEYIRDGSLDKHITDELRGLEWETRYEIITGICKGLRHLHEEKNIIHMDLKPANILLHRDDKYVVPKITDFGLSRLNENSHTVGLPEGTRGYIAPEYSGSKKTTPACDIYSLGAIIRELVTGCMDVPNKDNVLRRWRHRWNKPPTQLQYQQVTRCIDMAERCREQNPEARPSISKIIRFLSESETTHGQENTYLDDDMLGIEPLELRFTFKLNKDDVMLGIVNLTNKTKAYFAFNIEIPSKQCTILPDKGIVPPGCNKYHVHITVQSVPQVTHNFDKFIVRSTKVSESFGAADIIEDIFCPKVGKVVDEVDFMVLYEHVSLKRGRDPDVPVEVVSHKAIKSSIYEDCERGQCTAHLDHRNFQPPKNFSHSQATNMAYLLRDSDRAIDVTRGAMGSLLHKLGVLDKEFNLKTSIEKDANELVKMQQVLRKVSAGQQNNLDDLVKRWACNVREMSYDLEDFVDGFLVPSEPESERNSFRMLTHEKYFLSEKGKMQQLIGDLIKHHISTKIQDAAEKCKEYKVDNIVPNAPAKVTIDELRNLSIYKDKEKLVGIETPRDEIIMLFEEDSSDILKQDLRIVSIVGLGGLGKTTLAKAVYDKLNAQHDLKAFISVGQNPDVKKLLKNIIGKFVPGYNAESLEDLVEKIQKIAQG